MNSSRTFWSWSRNIRIASSTTHAGAAGELGIIRVSGRMLPPVGLMSRSGIFRISLLLGCSERFG